MRLQVAVVVAFLFVPLACSSRGTFKAYDGPERSPDELAYVVRMYEDHPEVADGFQPLFSVYSVDERWCHAYDCIALVPGPHTLEVLVRLERDILRGGGKLSGGTVLVPCTLAAGRVYRVVGKVQVFDQKAGRVTFDKAVEDVTGTYGRDGRTLAGPGKP